MHMGGCQNHGPFLGTPNSKCRIIIGIQKRTIVLTTAHICICIVGGTPGLGDMDVGFSRCQVVKGLLFRTPAQGLYLNAVPVEVC